MRLRFSLRDALWLTLVVALIMWRYVDSRQASQLREALLYHSIDFQGRPDGRHEVRFLLTPDEARLFYDFCRRGDGGWVRNRIHAALERPDPDVTLGVGGKLRHQPGYFYRTAE